MLGVTGQPPEGAQRLVPYENLLNLLIVLKTHSLPFTLYLGSGHYLDAGRHHFRHQKLSLTNPTIATEIPYGNYCPKGQ